MSLFRETGCKATCEGVLPQHDLGQSVGLDRVCFRPQKAKIGGILTNRPCQSLLASEERPGQGGGVPVFTPVLLKNGKHLGRGVYFLRFHGEDFLPCTPL